MTVFGRIDIQYPAGRSETYHLAEDAISIGSAAGNSIQVPDASLAPRHLRFSHSGEAIYLTNLAAGHLTTIDGLPAPVYEPQRLQQVARIRAGDLQIVFNWGSLDPTVAMEAIREATRPTAAGFRAALESGALQVWQYSSASTVLSVTNTRDEAALFSVSTAGPPAEWTQPESLRLSVEAKDTVDLLFHVKPEPQKNLAPGEYPLTITVRRLDGGQAALQLVLLVQLGAVGGLSAALDPPSLRPGRPFSLRLLNLGNAELPLRFRPRDPDQRLNIMLAQTEVRLKAGEGAAISGVAELLRRPIVGARADLSFALLAAAGEPNDYVVALPATVAVKPVLERRLLIAGALMLCLLILAVAALLYQPPQPEIASFTVSEALVAQGTPVELSWTAQQAQRFVLEVNRAPVAELPGEAANFALDTGGYADPIEIALIALNGDATAIRSLRLDVYQPVSVIKFEADASALLRGIPSELTISWRVEGAAAMDIALPAGFETIRETITEDEGEIVIKGIADADFQISLSAEDEIGGKTTRALPIMIQEPECTPIQDTLLYAGPDARFEGVNYALRNVPVRAAGVKASADWLQVELASGERGWGFHTNFRCQGFKPADLTVISDIPRLPRPTLSPPPTLTSTPAPTQTRTPTSIPAGRNP